MPDKEICPLLVTPGATLPCLKKACAWYLRTAESCAIAEIAWSAYLERIRIIVDEEDP